MCRPGISHLIVAQFGRSSKSRRKFSKLFSNKIFALCFEALFGNLISWNKQTQIIDLDTTRWSKNVGSSEVIWQLQADRVIYQVEPALLQESWTWWKMAYTEDFCASTGSDSIPFYIVNWLCSIFNRKRYDITYQPNIFSDFFVIIKVFVLHRHAYYIKEWTLEQHD